MTTSVYNARCQVFTVNSMQQSQNLKHFKKIMKNHAHKKKKKASFPLTLPGSLLQLTILSPCSLIYPWKEGSWE